ncbi:Aste57867_15276 [Aphanomyces stellatus]|uniref:Aste57867_15276 protein n=1 Tax=Aphanomyces stellatus TaxID=120398 RepID=A0A485L4L0_9STRA|nr:hypothetical protein As57867_015220 [Aphanomyces stellatus]VFT92085.1 Aste57867_15276 [Aphanomyces stellatus]
MSKILNEVQFLHKFNSTHVLKFHNWYESSNHIWIIFEFCIGGDLLNLITQDKSLPESSIKGFGHDIMMGLQYLHANGVIYCDLKPANVLIDEYGCLKLSDFGLARKIPTEESAQKNDQSPGSPHYMAPELFDQLPVHSFASDFWALGCVLYELRTGSQPFANCGFMDLRHMIQNAQLELPPRNATMSGEFCDLLTRLLEKSPSHRITWDELLQHPFWENRSSDTPPPLPPQEYFSTRYPRPGPTPAVTLSQPSPPLAILSGSHSPRSPIGRRSVTSNDSNSTSSNDGEVLTMTRPVTAPLPKQSQNDAHHHAPVDETVPQEYDKPQLPPPKTAPERQPPPRPVKAEKSVVKEARRRIFTTADCTVKPIVGNTEIESVPVPLMNDSPLRCRIATVESLVLQKDIEAQLELVYHFLRADATVAEKHNMLAYLYGMSISSKFANIIVNSSLMTLLVKLLQQSTSSVLSSRLCHVLGVLVRFATFIAPDVSSMDKEDGFIPVLTNLLREQSNVQITRRAMACLGEIGFYISTQSHPFGTSMVDCLICGLEDADAIVRHYAVRAICNILTHAGHVELVAHFVTPAVAHALLDHGFQDGLSDALQMSTMQTLSQVLKHANAQSFAHLKDDIFDPVAMNLAHVWDCVSRGDYRLTIASLNVLNATLEHSSNASTDDITGDFLSRIESLDNIRRLLEKREYDEMTRSDARGQVDGREKSGRFKDGDTKLTNLVHGKSLLLLYFGLHASRDFAMLFVEANLLEVVEPFLTTSDGDAASSAKKYALQSAQQLASLTVRIALEVTFSLAEETTPAMVSLFGGLYQQLLKQPACRQHCMNLLLENSCDEYECFVAGVAKLLAAAHATNSVVDILLLVFDNADIVTHVEELDTLWFTTAFVQVAHVLGDASWSPDILANCVRILYNALAIFPPSTTVDEFIVQHLLPTYHALLHATTNESVRRFAVELLYDLVHRDIAFVSILNRLKLISPLVGLLAHTMSPSVTKLLLLIHQSKEVPVEALYAMDLPKLLGTAVADAQKRSLLVPASDMCELTYALLYEHYFLLRSKTPEPTLDMCAKANHSLLKCIPTFLLLCVRSSVHSNVPDDSNEDPGDDGCDKASRCFSVLCQLYEHDAFEWLFDQENGNSSPLVQALAAASNSVRFRCLQGLKIVLVANPSRSKLSRPLVNTIFEAANQSDDKKVAAVASEIYRLVV